MESLINILQNPFLKMFVSPLSLILFGVLYGIQMSNQTYWLVIIALIIVVISGEFISHYFYIKYDRQDQQASPMIIQIIFEIFLFGGIILFAMNAHWILSLLLILYALFIHLQYFPYNFSGTFNQMVLSTFFNGFLLNLIAFYSQTLVLTQDFLFGVIPIVLMQLALSIYMMNHKHQLLTSRYYPIIGQANLPIFSLAILAIASGFFLSLPSRSYFIMQILYLLVMILAIIPFLVATDKEQQQQRKINYLHATALIFSLLYSLSHWL